MKFKIRIPLLAGVLLTGIAVTAFAGWQTAFAGTLTKSTIMEYNMETSGQGNIAIAFKTATASATSVSINFSGIIGASGSISSSGLAVTGTGCSTLFPTATGVTASAPTFSTPTVSFTVSSLSISTYYCAIITSTAGLVVNPSAANVYTSLLTVGSDTQTDAYDVIANDSYTVTGTVAPTFTMSLPATSDTFTTNLSSTAVTSTTGVTATINTNAASGWLLWAKDSNGALNSVSSGGTIPAVSTSSNVNMTADEGSADYAMGVTSVSAGAATTDYADSGGSTGAGLSSSTYNEIASDASPASSDAVVVKELADISATTPPGSDYTDTITIVGAGSF